MRRWTPIADSFSRFIAKSSIERRRKLMGDTVAVDNQVIQAGRAKLADKYEKCYRRITKYVDRANRDPSIGAIDMLAQILDDLGRTFE
jgi:hypothetical protein